MFLKNDILKEELEFPKLFASYIEKPYGILFYNEDDKESHDSNHAILYPEKIVDFNKTIKEITDFYMCKNLTPRIYQPFKTGYFNNHKESLSEFGYQVELYGNSRFMILSEQNQIIPSNIIEIRRITKWDDRIATDIYIPAGEEYGVDVERKSLENSNYYLFGGFLDNEIVSLVSFHTSLNNCTRFDYILTAEKHKRKGFAKELLGFTVNYCIEKDFKNCYQWPANEISEKTSTRAGFRVAFEEEAASAVYSFAT